MDEELLALERRWRAGGAVEDALRWHAALVRSGRSAEIARLVAEAARLGRRIDPVLDALAPPTLEALVPGSFPGRAWRRCINAAWSPDERTLYVVDEATAPWETAILRWELHDEPRLLLDDQPLRALTGRPHLGKVETLLVDPEGQRLVLGLEDPKDRPTTGWSTWCVLDPVSGKVEALTRSQGWPRAWWGDRVIGVQPGGELLAWQVGGGAPPTSFARGTLTAAGPGTCVTCARGTLRWLDPITGRETAQVSLGTEATSPRLFPAWGGRMLLHRRQEVLLVGPAGLLARATLPPAPVGELRALRPCPSGRVVALFYGAWRRFVLRLLDLASGAVRDIRLAAPPSELAWSPSGAALAMPSAQGLLVLDGGLGLDAPPPPAPPPYPGLGADGRPWAPCPLCRELGLEVVPNTRHGVLCHACGYGR